MQLTIHTHGLRNLVHVLREGGLLDRLITFVPCPVQALLALAGNWELNQLSNL